MSNHTHHLYGGLVWIFSGLVLLLYGGLGLTKTNIPGVADLVNFISTAEGGWLFLAAFIAILLEGLYVIGSFFPGSTLVLIIAILAQIGGPGHFLGVILSIYIGWLIAGLVNVLGAKFFSRTFLQKVEGLEKIQDNTGLTWFPAFRANTEVAQITEGHSVKEVLLSSWRVKTIASLGMVVYALLVPLLIDIQDVTNEEGFWSLGIIAIVSFCVGGYKLWEYKIME